MTDLNERWEREDAEHREAAEKFAAAVREYLWAMVRISGYAEWETDPDFALLAVARVVCQYVCYQKLDQGTDPDEHLIGAICELTEALEDFGCRLS
jgi:hypothetical protein